VKAGAATAITVDYVAVVTFFGKLDLFVSTDRDSWIDYNGK